MKTEKKYKRTHTYRCLSSMLQTNEFSEMVQSKCRQKSTRYECIRIRSSEKICISRRRKKIHIRTSANNMGNRSCCCIKVATRVANAKSTVSFFPCFFPLFLQQSVRQFLNQMFSSPFLSLIRLSLLLLLSHFGWIVHNSSIAMNWADLISSSQATFREISRFQSFKSHLFTIFIIPKSSQYDLSSTTGLSSCRAYYRHAYAQASTYAPLDTIAPLLLGPQFAHCLHRADKQIGGSERERGAKTVLKSHSSNTQPLATKRTYPWKANAPLSISCVMFYWIKGLTIRNKKHTRAHTHTQPWNLCGINKSKQGYMQNSFAEICQFVLAFFMRNCKVISFLCVLCICHTIKSTTTVSVVHRDEE